MKLVPSHEQARSQLVSSLTKNTALGFEKSNATKQLFLKYPGPNVELILKIFFDRSLKNGF
jgi:hypothetical protein